MLEGNLATRIAAMQKSHQRFPESTVQKWLAQLLLGTAAIHRARILHMDLKPANILFESQDHLRIADFGISKVLKGSHVSSGGYTLAYASPEALNGEPRYKSNDIWALGCLAYELCCLKVGLTWHLS